MFCVVRLEVYIWPMTLYSHMFDKASLGFRAVSFAMRFNSVTAAWGHFSAVNIINITVDSRTRGNPSGGDFRD